MRQALHIFYKDIRQLRYDIIVTLVLTATFAWYVGQAHPSSWVPNRQIEPSGRLAWTAATLCLGLLGGACYLWRAASRRSPILGHQALSLEEPPRRQSTLHRRVCDSAAPAIGLRDPGRYKDFIGQLISQGSPGTR